MHSTDTSLSYLPYPAWHIRTRHKHANTYIPESTQLHHWHQYTRSYTHIHTNNTYTYPQQINYSILLIYCVLDHINIYTLNTNIRVRIHTYIYTLDNNICMHYTHLHVHTFIHLNTSLIYVSLHVLECFFFQRESRLR